MRRIAALYAVEAAVRGQPPDVRRAARQANSRALVAALFTWFEAQLLRLPGRAPTAEAIRHALNHREGLERFLDDGRIDIDSNVVERAIRQYDVNIDQRDPVRLRSPNPDHSRSRDATTAIR